MYCCIECGHIFDKNEVAIWKEHRGEYCGTQCYEEISGCPHCYGGYVETYRCSECSEWINGEYIKLNDGRRICADCYEPYDLGDE